MYNQMNDPRRDQLPQQQIVCNRCGNKLPKTFVSEPGVEIVCAKCAEKPSSETSQTPSDLTQHSGERTIQVTAGALNVRNGPGKDFKILEVLKKGTKVIVTSEETDKESNVWGRINSNETKWIQLRHTKQM